MCHHVYHVIVNPVFSTVAAKTQLAKTAQSDVAIHAKTKKGQQTE